MSNRRIRVGFIVEAASGRLSNHSLSTGLTGALPYELGDVPVRFQVQTPSSGVSRVPAGSPVARGTRPCYITYMPRGSSGRIVLEIEPRKKRKLYAALDEEGVTLKDWFLCRVEEYLARSQPSLFDEHRDSSKHT